MDGGNLLKYFLVANLFISFSLFAAEEIPPKPEAPYPGAETEPEDTPPIKKQSTETAPSTNYEGEIIQGNKFRGTRKIKHPDAKRGLYKITTKGEYLYRTTPSPSDRAISVKFGMYQPKNLLSSETPFDYNDLYTSDTGFVSHFDYEWRLYSGLGKLGLKLGSGIFIASGNARFANTSPSNPTGVAEEKLTLFMLPNTAAATLYLQFWDRQPLIPYGEAGLDAYVFNEYRDDGQPPLGRFGGSLAAHFSGGVLLPLRIFDKNSMIRLDQEYGINDVYISAEYRYVTYVAGRFDFSASYFTGGVMVEF